MSYKDAQLRHAQLKVELYEAMAAVRPESYKTQQQLAETRNRLAELQETPRRVKTEPANMAARSEWCCAQGRPDWCQAGAPPKLTSDPRFRPGEEVPRIS